MYHSQKKRNLKLARICTYNRLIGLKFLSDIEHEQHESNKTKQLFAHCGPWHRGRRCIHTIPDVHVKIPVHLEKQTKKKNYGHGQSHTIIVISFMTVSRQSS